MKILIAEDNPRLQASYVPLFEGWGIDFDMADNGREAVEKVAANEGKYDLCLMDINMPVMDGYEAALIIRRDYKYFPIVALTAKADHIIKDKFAAAGMDDYITKPCDPNILSDKIKELTVKVYKMSFKKNEIYFIKETPGDPDQLKELIELAKKESALLIIDGDWKRFAAYKNIQNEISIDNSDNILGNRSGRCHPDKANLHVKKAILVPEVLEAVLKAEEDIVIRYGESFDREIEE